MKKLYPWLLALLATPAIAALYGPFLQSGHTFVISTNATAATTQSTLVKLSDLNMQQAPASLRLVNTGTVPIYYSITPTAQPAVLPTPGTTTAGVPTSGKILLPGVPEVFGAGAINQNVAGGPTPGVPSNSGFWVNTISANASQLLYITPGEGM